MTDDVEEAVAAEQEPGHPIIASYLVRITEREVPHPDDPDYETPKARTNEQIEMIIETALGGPYVEITATSERLDR